MPLSMPCPSHQALDYSCDGCILAALREIDQRLAGLYVNPGLNRESILRETRERMRIAFGSIRDVALEPLANRARASNIVWRESADPIPFAARGSCPIHGTGPCAASCMTRTEERPAVPTSAFTSSAYVYKNRVILRLNYKPEFVEELKARFPKGYRLWNSDDRTWTIYHPYIEPAIALARNHYSGVTRIYMKEDPGTGLIIQEGNIDLKPEPWTPPEGSYSARLKIVLEDLGPAQEQLKDKIVNEAREARIARLRAASKCSNKCWCRLCQWGECGRACPHKKEKK